MFEKLFAKFRFFLYFGLTLGLCIPVLHATLASDDCNFVEDYKQTICLIEVMEKADRHGGVETFVESLNQRDYQLVIAYLTVDPQKSSMRPQIVTEPLTSPSVNQTQRDTVQPNGANLQCRDVVWLLDVGKNTLGHDLFKYYAKIEWCYNQKKIKNYVNYFAWGEVYAIG